jgi:hypothetical protein
LKQFCSGFGCLRGDGLRHRRCVFLRDQRHARFGNACLFKRYAVEWRFGRAILWCQKKAFVVNTERGYAAHGGGSDDVGRVEPSTEADFDNARIGWGASKGEEGDGGGDFEEAGLQPFGVVENFGEQSGEGNVVDQLPSNPDSFIEPNQMRTGVNVGSEARRLDSAAHESAGRSFAVGARYVEHRRQFVVRVVEAIKQSGDALKPEDIAPRREHSQPVELRLDSGVSGDCKVSH